MAKQRSALSAQTEAETVEAPEGESAEAPAKLAAPAVLKGARTEKRKVGSNGTVIQITRS